MRLVQYTFISANNGTSRTYKKVIHSHTISKSVGKGEKRELHYQMSIPTVSHQTAIGTLVANYYRLEITA